MAASAVFLGIGFGLPVLPAGLLLYAVSVLIWTMGEIIGATVAPAFVADLSPADMRGLYQGVFGAAWGLSAFVGPLLGGWALERLGAHGLWAGCFIAGLLLAGAFLGMAGPAERRMRRLDESPRPASEVRGTSEVGK